MRDGDEVSTELVRELSQVVRSLLFALDEDGIAPKSWAKSGHYVRQFVYSEILHDSTFEFTRYCSGNWKLHKWMILNYGSFYDNHLKDKESKSESKRGKGKGMVKLEKIKALNDPTLIIMDSDTLDVTQTASSSREVVFPLFLSPLLT